MKTVDLLKQIREADEEQALNLLEAAMEAAKLKTGHEIWCRATEMVDTEHRLMDIGTDDDGQPCPVYLCGRYYDADGDLMLVAVSMDMTRMPFAVVDKVRQVVQAQEMAPVMVLPPQVSMMRFRPISNREAERVKARLADRQREAEKVMERVRATLEGKAPEPRKLKLV